MPYEHSSAKKKRIILSTHRKNAPQNLLAAKQTEDSHVSQMKEFKEDGLDQSMLFNCASINNSLQIFDQDPKNRHFQFLQNEEDRIEALQSNVKSKTQVLQTMPSTANMLKKSVKIGHLASKNKQLSMVGSISLSSLHSPTHKFFSKKLTTSSSRKFIDVTLKKDLKRLSHQSSASELPLCQQPEKNCMNRGNTFEMERSILSSVSVNAVQFTLPRKASQRKKVLTITCQKYELDSGTKKVKSQNISKCNSIKLFRKCV